MGNNNTRCCNTYCDGGATFGGESIYAEYTMPWGQGVTRIYPMYPLGNCYGSQYSQGDCGDPHPTYDANVTIKTICCDPFCPIELTATMPYEVQDDCCLDFAGGSESSTCCGDSPSTGTTLSCGDDCGGDDEGSICFPDSSSTYTETDGDWYPAFTLSADTKFFTYFSGSHGCEEFRGALKRITLTLSGGPSGTLSWYFEGLSGLYPNRVYRAGAITIGTTVQDMVDGFELNSAKGIITSGVTDGGSFLNGWRFGDGETTDEIDLSSGSVQVYYQRKPKYGRTFSICADTEFCACQGQDCECPPDGWGFSVCYDECIPGCCTFKNDAIGLLTDAEQGMRVSWMEVTVSPDVDIDTLHGESITLNNGVGGTQVITVNKNEQCGLSGIGQIGLQFSEEADFVHGKIAGSIANGIMNSVYTTLGMSVVSQLTGGGCGTIPIDRQGLVRFFILQRRQGSPASWVADQSSGNTDVVGGLTGVTFSNFTGGTDAVLDVCDGVPGSGWVTDYCTGSSTVSGSTISWS